MIARQPDQHRAERDRRGDGVQLLVADPELARDLPAAERRIAERLTVPLLTASRGAWQPVPPAAAAGWTGTALVLLDGVLTREVLLHDRVAAQLLSPGDVVVPAPPSDTLVPASVRWTVNEDTTFAVLDERFARAVARWPVLAARVQDRVAAQADRLAVHMAISQLGRVELRVLALLWHLAERWGKVTLDGVVVPLALTHAIIGRLVGAKRPTVTLAVGTLGAEGSVIRRADGTWLLRDGAQAVLEPRSSVAPTVSSAATVTMPAGPVAAPDTPLERADLAERTRALREQQEASAARTASIVAACRETTQRSSRLRARLLRERAVAD